MYTTAVVDYDRTIKSGAASEDFVGCKSQKMETWKMTGKCRVNQGKRRINADKSRASLGKWVNAE